MFVLNPIVWLLALVFAFAFVGLDRGARWAARHVRSWRSAAHVLPASRATTS